MSNGGNSVFFTDEQTLESYSLANQFAEHLEFILVKDKITATQNDVYYSLSLAIRDRLIRKWLRTQQKYKEDDVKRVYYLSMEFLIGRLLGNALINMDFYHECYEILKKEGHNLEHVRELEKDMGLGNGGLGRLAACFLDSMATMELPAFGYGIRYEYGIFSQAIENGWQVEKPDHWLSYGNPWEIFRRELIFRVKFYGRIVSRRDEHNRLVFDWVDTEDVLAVGYDVPVPGYHTNTVNNLRLWQAKATDEFSFKEFNAGNYIAAVENKNLSENISKVLYPNDEYTEGKFLRLRQQYFFVSASLQDIIRKYKINHHTFDRFAEKTAIQLNDTHPVIAIPELMRILIDQENMEWEKAWQITVATFAYTNHTVVPEALEEWPVSIMEQLLPRHLQIIFEINFRFLEFVRQNVTRDDAIISELSIIHEFPEKRVRMANLAIVGAHKVNGVAALHTEILKTQIFKHFYRVFPDKFINITNGISPRRWLKTANPFLANAITEKIGDQWVIHLAELHKLEQFVDDVEFQDEWRNAKWVCKKVLVDYVRRQLNLQIDPDSLFDMQVKRFHEYKRQLLNLLHVITLYNRLRNGHIKNITPRTVFFAGKAAPGYYTAKLIIKLINSVANVINNDPQVNQFLKVIFLKDYSVTLAEQIIPAADLSEQISTAGLEASGTGNMKFALNGALTIGTMDGANIEIRKEVGDDNIFIFGMLANEVLALKKQGYQPYSYYQNNSELREVIDMIATNFFSPYEIDIFKPIVDHLLYNDRYCLLADYQSYIDTQDKVAECYQNRTEWIKKSILNSARIGYFSSDRSIKEYSEKIWDIESIKIDTM